MLKACRGWNPPDVRSLLLLICMELPKALQILYRSLRLCSTALVWSRDDFQLSLHHGQTPSPGLRHLLPPLSSSVATPLSLLTASLAAHLPQPQSWHMGIDVNLDAATHGDLQTDLSPLKLDILGGNSRLFDLSVPIDPPSHTSRVLVPGNIRT
jgi:hypothetical protein